MAVLIRGSADGQNFAFLGLVAFGGIGKINAGAGLGGLVVRLDKQIAGCRLNLGEFGAGGVVSLGHGLPVIYTKRGWRLSRGKVFVKNLGDVTGGREP